jgi:four helix bundle protein
MASKSFEQLRVYKMAEELSDLIWHIVLRWQPIASSTVGGQIIRSADSIGANIAEGYGRGTYADNRRFVRMSRGSLYETRHWLRRAFTRKLLTQKHISQIKPLIDSLGPQLNAFLRSIGANSKSTNTND